MWPVYSWRMGDATPGMWGLAGGPGLVAELVHAIYHLWRRGDGNILSDVLPSVPAACGASQRL